jgi:hypothetical protein
MVLDGVELGSRSLSAGFHVGKSKSTLVVFMHGDLVGKERGRSDPEGSNHIFD